MQVIEFRQAQVACAGTARHASLRDAGALIGRAARLFVARATVLMLTFVSTSCSAPSLLITPVSPNRELVETRLSSDSWLARDKVALVDVSGVLMNAHQPKLLSQGEHPVSMLLEQLDKARCDPAVKAVILRINSPGGTVVASELIHDEIMHFRRGGKPVVAVMMDVAASGGYYIACAADEIIAQPSTVTGSIGVIMQMFNLTGSLEKLGVGTDAITSGVHKDTGSPLRPMRPEERAIFQGIVDDMYERFIDVVVAGRPKLDEAAVRRLADGRVYTAGQALDAGLIDRIATMREAVESAKRHAGARHVRLVTYHRPLAYRPNYYAETPTPSSGEVNLLRIDLPDWLRDSTPRFMYLWRP